MLCFLKLLICSVVSFRKSNIVLDHDDNFLTFSLCPAYKLSFFGSFRYRGLKNFASSPWDPMENLPHDYARIYRFENFKLTKKKALTSEKEGAMVTILSFY